MRYPKSLLDALQFAWGPGFLSPGGPESVARVLSGETISGKRVLDIGSGLGGVDVVLVERHGAGEVIGIDVEAELVEEAARLVASKDLSDRIRFETVRPGPLTFEDSSFDLVFSKDAFVLIPDKAPLFRDIMRVLRPGGLLLAADWLWAEGAEKSPVVRDWLAEAQSDYSFTVPEKAVEALQAAGFVDVSVVDCRRFMQAATREEIRVLEGPAQRRLAELVGEDRAARRLRNARRRLAVLDSGQLIPSDVRAKKPQLSV